jgi:hypothetical protein
LKAEGLQQARRISRNVVPAAEVIEYALFHGNTGGAASPGPENDARIRGEAMGGRQLGGRDPQGGERWETSHRGRTDLEQ